MLGDRVDHAKMVQSRTTVSVAFGASHFSVIQMIKLTRQLTPKEVVEFNASVQMFNLTLNAEPPTAIIKAHVPVRSGLLPQTAIDLLAYSENMVEKLIRTIGSESVRSV